MRVSLRTESRDPEREFWGSAIRAELESWNPDRLPERFQPRGVGARARRRQAETWRRAWRPLALAAAAFAAGMLAHGLAPAPAGVPGVVRVVTDGRLVPSPARVPVVDPTASLDPSPTTAAHGQAQRSRPASETARPVTAPRVPPAPAAQPAVPETAPQQPVGPLPPVPAPAPAPAPTPTPACLLGIACI